MDRPKRIIVTGAGGGGSNNLITSIRQSRYPVYIVGTNIDKFFLKKSIADKNYLIPRGTEEGYIPTINKLIELEKIELIVPNNDTEVRAISENREKIKCRTFLPAKETVALCQDKYVLNQHLSEKGIGVAKTFEIKSVDSIDSIFRKFNTEDTLWCRMREGSGSKGAIPVRRPDQVKFWIRYWEEMRGISSSKFLLSEYLPGRDYAFQSIWKNGEVIIAKALQRLTYYGGDNRVSGVSSTPQIGKLVRDERVINTCVKAIRALDERPTGNFCIDLKENKFGEPCITEINIGRFFMITNIFNLVGKYNMAEVYLKLAFDEPVDVRDKFGDIDEETYLIRELDTLPEIANLKDIEANVNTIDIRQYHDEKQT